MAITTEHSSGITEENVAKIATLIQELKQEIASDNGSFPLNSIYIFPLKNIICSIGVIESIISHSIFYGYPFSHFNKTKISPTRCEAGKQQMKY